MTATLCLTFDNMGSAFKVGSGELSGPGPDDEGPLGYPEALAILDDLGLKATFFIEGWNALHNPEAVMSLATKGHEVAVHAWTHDAIGSLSEVDVGRVISDSTAAFRNLGFTNLGFRAPGGKRGPFLEKALRKHGYCYDSSVDHGVGAIEEEAQRDTPMFESGLIPVLPWRWRNIDFYQYEMHPDGGRSPRDVTEHFTRQLEDLAQNGGIATFIFHPSVSCVDPVRKEAFRQILQHAAREPNLQVRTARQVIAELMSQRAETG
jgi:peptidoglycan/xylan/chitin deacetylase (PgdA/CDA1 family)